MQNFPSNNYLHLSATTQVFVIRGSNSLGVTFNVFPRVSGLGLGQPWWPFMVALLLMNVIH